MNSVKPGQAVLAESVSGRQQRVEPLGPWSYRREPVHRGEGGVGAHQSLCFRFDRHSSEDGIERTEFLVPLEDHEAGAEMFVPNGYQRSQEVGVGERQLDRIAPGPPSGPYVGKLLD